MRAGSPLLAVCLVLASAPVQAQQAAPVDSVPATLAQVLDRAKSDRSRVRATLSESRWLTGQVEFVGPGEVVIGDAHLPLEEISLLERSVREPGGGWKAGAAIGAIAIASLAVMFAGYCESECDGTRELFAGGVIGGLLGMAVGEWVAPSDYSWRTVWAPAGN